MTFLKFLMEYNIILVVVIYIYIKNEHKSIYYTFHTHAHTD